MTRRRYRPFFADPDVPEWRKQQARRKGGILGGRRPSLNNMLKRLDPQLRPELRTPDQILRRLEELAQALEKMELSVSNARVLLDVYRAAWSVAVEREEVDRITRKIIELEERIEGQVR